jgi:hypothetical protein
MLINNTTSGGERVLINFLLNTGHFPIHCAASLRAQRAESSSGHHMGSPSRSGGEHICSLAKGKSPIVVIYRVTTAASLSVFFLKE